MTTAGGGAGGPDAPGSDQRPVPWVGLRAVVDAVAIYLLAQVAVAGLVIGSGANGTPTVVLVLLSPIVLLVVSGLWLAARYGRRAGAVVGRAWRWSDLAIGVGVGVGCFVGLRLLLVAIVALLTAAGLEVPAVQDTFRVIAEDRATAPALAVTAVLLAPLGEELLFRGLVFTGLRERYGFALSALASAGLFTLAHLGDGGGPLADAIIVAGILPLGLVFAAVMERRRSLLACASAHAVYNAGGVALLIGSALGG